MTLRTVLLSGLVAGALGGAVPVLAGPQPALAFRLAVTRRWWFAPSNPVLRRDPHPYELRRYALLMDDYGWSEQDVRRDLTERSDYRRYSQGSALDTDAIITRAYEDILGRAPDAAGMRTYRKHIIEEGWTEQDVRQALRQSPEYRSTTRRTTSAERIITRAYQDVLKREPDPSGLDTYRRAIIEDGWDAQDRPPGAAAQRRGRGQRGVGTGALSQDPVTLAVRNAYLAVLDREPDAAGLRDYGARVVQDNWSQADIERALRDSPEYRTKNR